MSVERPDFLHHVIGNLPQGISLQPGETWYFQFWYRDGGSFNFSNALEIAFEHAWSLCITNPAANAPPELAERCFDAFWRADSARTTTGRHAGLGLALCQRIAQQLGARIDARLTDGRFSVTLHFPSSTAG